MIVIAPYRKAKTWSLVITMWLVISCVPYVTFWSYGGHFLKIALTSYRGIVAIPGIAAAWIFGVYVAVALIAVLKQILFEQNQAVWIEQGKLVFIRRWLFAVDCNQIQSVSRGQNGQSILLELRNGTQKTLPSGALAESNDVIIDRLTSALSHSLSPKDNLLSAGRRWPFLS